MKHIFNISPKDIIIIISNIILKNQIIKLNHFYLNLEKILDN
jgi:hypothetical protein